MCVLSIKVPIRKKSGNLFNDPRMYGFDPNLQLTNPLLKEPVKTSPFPLITG